MTWHSPRINNRVKFFLDSFISSDTKSASTALPCIILTNWMSLDLLTCQFVFFGFIFFKMACSCVEGQHAILITTYVRESLVHVVLAIIVSDFCSSAEICFSKLCPASLYLIKLACLSSKHLSLSILKIWIPFALMLGNYFKVIIIVFVSCIFCALS